MRGFTYQAIDKTGKVFVKPCQSKQYVLDQIIWWKMRKGIALKIIQVKLVN